MRVLLGILLPIAETDSGTILRYGDIRDAALQAERDRFEFTSAEDLADQWRGFEEQDVAHLIVWPQPYESECLRLVIAAPRNYRAGSGK